MPRPATFTTINTAALAAAAGMLVAPGALGQSDPSGFAGVFNIGTVPAGSIFDVPGAVNGTFVGDLDFEPYTGGAVTLLKLDGDYLPSNRQLNLFDGGEIRPVFTLGFQSVFNSRLEANLFGGVVGEGFVVKPGGVVNISGGVIGSIEIESAASLFMSGGSIGPGSKLRSGSSAHFSGGNIGSRFDGSGGSAVFTGSDFRVDGVPTTSTPANFGTSSPASLITGFLADGTAVMFSADVDRLSSSSIQVVPLPPSENPGVLSSGTFSKGLRSGETLLVNGDGVLGDGFTVLGGVLTVEDARVGASLQVAGGDVTVSGGTVGANLPVAGTGVVHVDADSIGSFIGVFGGGSLSIAGGAHGGRLLADSGGSLAVSGGQYDSLIARSSSSVELSGDHFEVDGVATTDLSGGVGIFGSADVVAGVLADGNVFIASELTGDTLPSGATTLVTVPVAPSINPGVLSSGVFREGLRPGETLTVTGDGMLPAGFPVLRGVLNVDAGTIGDDLEIVGGQLTATGGSFDGEVIAWSGSTVAFSGNVVTPRMIARQGSAVSISDNVAVDSVFLATGASAHVSGGSVGRIVGNSDSAITISGGVVGNAETQSDAESINISGGVVDRVLTTSLAELSGGRMARLLVWYGAAEFIGAEFALNGDPITELPGGLSTGPAAPKVFTGVYADGTPFLYFGESDPGGNSNLDVISPGTAVLVQVPVPAPDNPSVLESGEYEKGLRPGRTMTVRGDGSLGSDFAVVGGTLNVESGHVGDRLEVANGQVNLSGGVIGDSLSALGDSVVTVSGSASVASMTAWRRSIVNVEGGSVEGELKVSEQGRVFVSGGSVDRLFAVRARKITISGGSIRSALIERSRVEITGGVFEDTITFADSGTVVAIAGGDFQGNVRSYSGTVVDLAGTEFAIDGSPITGLVIGEPFEVTARDVTLSGVFADGTPFSFDLSPLCCNGDVFSLYAQLTVTLVPGLCQSDLTGDGVTDLADLLQVLSSFGVDAGGDTNDDGVTDLADLLAVLAEFGEPCS